jgi:hypothetical protein
MLSLALPRVGQRWLTVFSLALGTASGGFAAEAGSRLLQLKEAVALHDTPDDTRLRPIEIQWKSATDSAAPATIEEVWVAGMKAPRGTQCTVTENSGKFAGEIQVPANKNSPAGTWRFDGPLSISESVARFSGEQAEQKISGNAVFLTVYGAGKPEGSVVRVWLPPGDAPVRGLFIWGNGAGGDERRKVWDERWRAFCSYYHFAFAATGHFDRQMGGSEGALLLHQLAEVAKMSERPELNHAPVLFSGHSNGGQMAWEFNAAHPARTIAIDVSKGGAYDTFDDLSPAADRTPVIMVAGEKDDPRRIRSILRLFNVHPKHSKPWAIALEPGMDHDIGKAEAVWLPFFAHAIEHRLTPAASAERASTLREVDISPGWIIDARGAVHPAKDLPDAERAKGNWLPDAATALAFTALNRYTRDLEIVATPETMALPPGQTLQLRLKELAAGEWKTVDLWIDGQKSASFTRNDQKLELPAMPPGVHSAVAIGRRENGKTSFAAPYAWVVMAAGSEGTNKAP